MAKAMGSKNNPSSNPAEEEFLCYGCKQKKKRKDFYMTEDPFNKVGISPFCKSCLEKIARRYDSDRRCFGDVTKTSLCEALERLDKPFFERLWNASWLEVNDTSLESNKSNVWSAYVKNIAMPQYSGLRWRDGEITSKEAYSAPVLREVKEEALKEDSEQWSIYQKNKKAVVNFVGWDPFKRYPNEEDLPLLYAQLLTFLDEETKNDGQKLNAVIQIVKLFNQAEKINNAIDQLQTTTQKIIDNTGAVKQLRDAASKAISDANSLAKDNGINMIVPMRSNSYIKTRLIAGNPLELLEPQSDMKICA